MEDQTDNQKKQCSPPTHVGGGIKNNLMLR